MSRITFDYQGYLVDQDQGEAALIELPSNPIWIPFSNSVTYKYLGWQGARFEIQLPFERTKSNTLTQVNMKLSSDDGRWIFHEISGDLFTMPDKKNVMVDWREWEPGSANYRTAEVTAVYEGFNNKKRFVWYLPTNFKDVAVKIKLVIFLFSTAALRIPRDGDFEIVDLESD